MQYARLHLLFGVGIFVVLVMGCSSWHPGAVDRTVEEPYDEVFQATLDLLWDRQFPLRTIDRQEGTIESGRRSIEDKNVGGPVEKVTVRLERIGARKTKVQLLLVFADQAEGNPLRVPRDGDGKRADDVARAAVDRSIDTGTVYDDYLDAIEQRTREQQEKE